MDKQKILIVDDSEMNRALLVDILEGHYDVVEAENGVEAISLLPIMSSPKCTFFKALIHFYTSQGRANGDGYRRIWY